MMPTARRQRGAALTVTLLVAAGAALLAPSLHHTGATQPPRSPANLARPSWLHLHLLATPVSLHEELRPGVPPGIDAAAGILVDVRSGGILWEAKPHRRLPPASLTKVLTALVALENLHPSQRVTVTADALRQDPDESRMGLQAGQVLTVEELLTGMLVVSGNDAATALAADTVGLERFVGAMNAQVAALGLHDSHFTTPVGLQDDPQYSSAFDLASISIAALRSQPLLRSIVAQRQVVLPAGPGHPEFDLSSVNLLLGMYPFAVGVKPGWTPQAGRCEVGMAVRDGHTLLSVLLNAPLDFGQTRRLLDWGFVQQGLVSTLPTPAPSPHA